MKDRSLERSDVVMNNKVSLSHVPGRRDSPEESAALPAGSRPARDYVSERRFPPAVTCFTDVDKATAAMVEDDDDAAAMTKESFTPCAYDRSPPSRTRLSFSPRR